MRNQPQVIGRALRPWERQLEMGDPEDHVAKPGKGRVPPMNQCKFSENLLFSESVVWEEARHQT